MIIGGAYTTSDKRPARRRGWPRETVPVAGAPERPRNAIVLQPGSSYLRIGLATDANPHLMRHIIAYKLWKKPRDSSTSPAENANHPVLLTELSLDVSIVEECDKFCNMNDL